VVESGRCQWLDFMALVVQIDASAGSSSSAGVMLDESVSG